MRRIIVLVGPTCSGKSTLEQELNRRGIPSIVSYTTRAQRTGEVHGQHYYFLGREEIAELEKRDRVVQKVEFAGNLYGSTVDSINAAFSKSNTAVIVVEPTGLTQFQRYAKQAGDVELVSVFVTNSLSTLVTRLAKRFESDQKANPAYYWERFMGILEQHQEWPYYTADWTHFIAQMDDSLPSCSVASVADRILGSNTR